MRAFASASNEFVTPLGALRLQSGASLPEVDVAYAAYGHLAPDGRNAILVTHGYTASHQMLAHGDGVAEGSWAALIGPGRVLDTQRFYIVCANMLGSCYGTTGPASIDPRSGQPYGPDFPEIALADIVQVQHRLLDHLGVRHLRAVVGPSYGGFQALQWALDFPEMIDAIAVVVSAPYLPPSPHMDLPTLCNALMAAPGWNAGRYHDQGDGVRSTLQRLRAATLHAYGMDEVLRSQGLDSDSARLKINHMAHNWAQAFDAHSLIVLLKAALAFDVRAQLHQVRSDVLHVVASSDQLFPPDAVRGTLVGTHGRRPMHYVEMETLFGHQASGPAHALWEGALRELLAR